MKKVVISLGHIIFLFLIFAENLPATDEKRLALLIGNSDYTSSGTLRNPINDVRAMKETLEALGFSVMKYENCTQKQMKEAIDAFGRKLKGQDVGLFFYAGHGVQVKGHNYLIPIDAKLDNENDAEYNCVRADRVLAKMEAAGSRTNIAILDACRDNPFARSWRRGAEGTGLAFMDAPSGSLIAYSTAPGRTALDGTGTNSIYTSALIHHIHTPNISALQMFQRVRSTVMGFSGGKQTPWESTSLKGDFFFKLDSGIREKNNPIVISPSNEKEDPSIQVIRAFDLNFKGNHIESLKILDDTIKLHPKFANAYRMRGNTFSKLEKYNEAIKDYTKAISLEPGNPDCYGYRADLYFRLGQHDKAFQDYNKAIELFPKSPEVYCSRAEAYCNLNQYSKAIQDYGKAIEFCRDTCLFAIDYYRDRGDAYANMNQSIKAIQDYNKALEFNPNDTFSLSSRAAVYVSLEQYTKAVEDYSKAIELDEEKMKNGHSYRIYYGDYLGRAYSFLKLNQPIKSIKDYDKYIELDPKNASAYAERGDVYARLKQYTQAIQDLTKAIELDPKFARAYALRANIYYDLNEPIKAIKDYDTAIELNFRYAWLYRRRGAIYLESLNMREQGCSDLKKACELGECEGLNIAKKMGYCR